MGRPPCCDKANVKRGLWTAEEDAKILAYVANHGIGNWTQVPKKAGLNRCGKSCRLRWTNYLRPDLKHEEFTEQEEELIVQFHAAIGSRWSLIAKQLPGRTDNDVKNYWNTKLKKKLAKMGIDPITHKPYSRILSDYESISSSCLTITHSIRSLNKTVPISRSFSYPEISSSDLLSRSPCPNPITGMPIMDIHHLGQVGVSTQESLSHYVFEEISPSSSSSSSSSSITLNGKPSSHMLDNDSSAAAVVMPSWGEPPFGDNIPNADIIEEECNFQKFLETDSGTQVIDKRQTSDSAGRNEMSDCCGPSGSPVSSFVKALLDRDSEMQLDFPAFGDILDY